MDLLGSSLNLLILDTTYNYILIIKKEDELYHLEMYDRHWILDTIVQKENRGV